MRRRKRYPLAGYEGLWIEAEAWQFLQDAMPRVSLSINCIGEATGDKRRDLLLFRDKGGDGELYVQRVTCVHTVVGEGTLEEGFHSTEHRPAKLSFEEHFWALCSFVQQIAEHPVESLTGECFDLSTGLLTRILHAFSLFSNVFYNSAVGAALEEILEMPDDFFISRLALLRKKYQRIFRDQRVWPYYRALDVADRAHVDLLISSR